MNSQRTENNQLIFEAKSHDLVSVKLVDENGQLIQNFTIFFNHVIEALNDYYKKVTSN